jgi:hypothetical protein
MDQFVIYFFMGFEHISDVKGYDHMLFVITLCAVYKIEDWRKMAILVTAFTIGHTVTLALSAFKIIVANVQLIEVLIPITILCTSINNLFYKSSFNKYDLLYKYSMALVFGFVHGMGFSNYFNALMGDSMNIIFPLFAFNLGIEIGQLMIVMFFFISYLLIQKIKRVEHYSWTIFFSGAGAGVAVIMIIERI